MEIPFSLAERNADQASRYAAFGGFSLNQTRKDLEELLTKIGQLGIFDQYTKHDISHIEAMLEKLEWLIPDATKSRLTAADWLLIVLSAYFHDLGMLVTKDEYAKRYESGFEQFRSDILLTDDADGRDYAARLTGLSDEEKERFLYQEFVRENHALRVKNWILGVDVPTAGVCTAVLDEVQRILAPLDPVFRDDLAQVCESHHLDDLYDTTIYPVQQYYGNDPQESANVQYAAVLLRTIDLLHITRDRTPSITFRVLNPSDPISQIEWAKQMAVRAVKPFWGLDPEGNRSETAPRDTIAIFAKFTDGDGFFGLTSYIRFAAKQLRQSHDWIQRSNVANGIDYQFPWKYIDTSRIQAKGFLTQTFQFSLDQTKVLDLLTGHTLYNDTDVVLRELIQNSLDAVRLQHGEESDSAGRVWVTWNPASRILEVCDNGSGMTQAIIENNLLKAGSSRYQDTEFRKKHPDFTPISRFGIGVLSTFMVADEVEILTCHPEEDEARQMSLRSVHGEYLVRTLNKSEIDHRIAPHGTCVRLKIRPSADVGDVVRVTQKWVVLPKCQVVVNVGTENLVKIGFKSVAHALRDAISRFDAHYHEQIDEGKIRIVEKELDGLSIAYAVRWNEYFNEWMFLSFPGLSREIHGLAGTCVGGIRVESTPPGFRRASGVWALANAWGPHAPRTNVARSEIDATPEFSRVVEKIYSAYCEHISEEVEQLQSVRSHSLTWATGEAAIISSIFAAKDSLPISGNSLKQSLSRIPLFLLEQGGIRKHASAEDLQKFKALRMTESAVMEHIEYLLRELPGGSRTSVIKVLAGAKDDWDESEPVICTRLGRDSHVDEFFLSAWQIAEMKANKSERSCDFRWIKRDGEPLWSSEDLMGSGLEHLITDQERYGRKSNQLVRIPIDDISISGFNDQEVGVRVGSELYLVPEHPWAGMVDHIKNLPDWKGPSDERVVALSWMIANVIDVSGRYYNPSLPALSDLLSDLRIRARRLEISHLFDWDDFATAAVSRELEFFDTRRWQRWGQQSW
ncbi:ATP-binding protein [Streptomyces sp. NPDC101116]|uniref:HD domain-containing protein n=1 Tax=Streptomyces sp. NPDC101116 TaxID=3366107 RepID=UPI00382E6BCD